MHFSLKYGLTLLAALFLMSTHSLLEVHASASEQRVMVSNVTGKAGETVHVPIMLRSDGNITALQLRIVYDANTLELQEVDKGAGLQSSFSLLANLDNGKLVVGSMGKAIGAGNQEVASAQFKIREGAAEGAYEVKLTEVSLTDSGANLLSNQFELVDGLLTVDNSESVPVTDQTPPQDEPDSPAPPAASSPPAASAADAIIMVNGKAADAGTVTSTTVNNQQVTIIQLDADMLGNLLGEDKDGALISIGIETESDVVVGEFDGQLAESMSQKHAIVEVKTDRATYSLPADQINISSLTESFGTDVNLSDITISLAIGAPPANVQGMVQDSAALGNFTLVAQPVTFTLEASLGSKTVEMSKFDVYVKRMIAIGEGMNPEPVTTGVVVEQDGTVRHVPTKIISVDGRYFAQINSLTNSTYAVVYHGVAFSDVDQHWAKETINDMGSRFIVTGYENGQFRPDATITRAEFSAILVKALGLSGASDGEAGVESSFSDVHASDWYAEPVSLARSYKLITGYDDGTFRPHAQITREEAMVMLARTFALMQLDSSLSEEAAQAALSTYKDGNQLESWSVIAAAKLSRLGIVQGNEGNLLPGDSITRAEATVMMKRLLVEAGLMD